MKFDLDSRKDCERLAQMIVAIQAEGVRFQLDRHDDTGGGLSRYATITFEA
jgi:hypothetical protein